MSCEDRCSGDGVWLRYYMEEGKQIFTRAGRVWDGLNTRCKIGGKYQESRKTYEGCVNLFQNFQTFCTWCQHQEGYLKRDKSGRWWALDKDLLGTGKHYSEDFCVFVPNEINLLLKLSKKRVHDLPIGVRERKDRVKKFHAQITSSGKNITLGHSYSPLAAHKLWQVAKIKEIEKRLFEYGESIDQRAVLKLKAIKDSVLNDIIFNRETKSLLGGTY